MFGANQKLTVNYSNIRQRISTRNCTNRKNVDLKLIQQWDNHLIL